MALSRNEIDLLLEALSITRNKEASCDDCTQRMAEFAETRLAGKSIPDGLRAIEHHLELCGECFEEFQALLAALDTG